jgi:transcriptional regulator with XRE-family HTH domain
MPAAKKKTATKPAPPIPPIRAEVGARLQIARKAAGLTQAEVAKHFEVNKSTVAAWESGRGAPDIYVLRELIELYKAGTDALLFGGQKELSANEVAVLEKLLNVKIGESEPSTGQPGEKRKR